MKWKPLAVGVACLSASACVPPPAGPSHNFVVSYVAPVTPSFSSPNRFTAVQGTITNTGPTAADYTVEVSPSSGETQSGLAVDVLAGQTATWQTLLAGLVTVSEVQVTSTATVAAPVHAVAAITSQKRVLYADGPGWLTVVMGTLTNTGTTTRDFAIELQATNGQVTTPRAERSPGAAGVLPGHTVTWVAPVGGNATARIIRVTNSSPPP